MIRGVAGTAQTIWRLSGAGSTKVVSLMCVCTSVRLHVEILLIDQPGSRLASGQSEAQAEAWRQPPAVPRSGKVTLAPLLNYCDCNIISRSIDASA